MTINIYWKLFPLFYVLISLSLKVSNANLASINEIYVKGREREREREKENSSKQIATELFVTDLTSLEVSL